MGNIAAFGPVTVDLFAGCGGMSLGFMRAGFNVVAAYEKWQPALDTYAKNFSHPAKEWDLGDVDSTVAELRKHKPQVIIGGPPCQDFSSAGKRCEADRADLTMSFAQIIASVRPKAFVMENVARARTSSAYGNARSAMKSAGYGLTEIVLDASRCGAPQARKRFFCVGLLGEQDGALLDSIDSRMSTEPMTMRQYFGDELTFDHYYRHPRNYNRRGIFSVDEPSPTVRGVNRPLAPGYPGHPRDTAPPTSGVQPLSTAWRARVQTFPADFVWVGSKTDCEQMIGNAVPVELGTFVAGVLGEFMGLQESRAV